FPLIMVSAVTPAVSEMKARGEQAEVKEFYTHGSLCLISAGLPFLLFSAVFADQLIHAWIGRQIPDAALAVRILSLGYFLNLSTGMACGTAIGMGRPDIEMRAGILTTIMNPLLSIVGLTFFGYKGALVATSFSLSAGAIYLLYLFRGVLSETLQSYFRLFFLPTLCAAMALLFIKSAEHIFFSVELPTPFEIRIFVPAAALTYGILYYLILSKTGHLTSTWKTFFRLKAKI
ncbi:MAG: polysaccharide biosynthesis C-terminal domain-containing protein, partial [Nitrospinota bacterium]